ncbi:hypothetical protein FQA39_LY01616 [Lamprigera yunnana]|nr:hypothetical protein FQA39_LY01616 [Lamprigera yunnana]
MAEELLVVLNRKDNSGFGFSLLGKPGLPPIIYNIIDDSPAAESGENFTKSNTAVDAILEKASPSVETIEK